MRAVSRLADVSINSVTKLLVDAGRVSAAFHDDQARGVKARRVQVNEIWSFTYAKQKNVAKASKAPQGAGDTWTWTGLDADSKLIVSWLVGGRDAGAAFAFTNDLASRLAGRVQLTSDGLKLYLAAVEDAFGGDVDYAMLVKIYGASGENETRYSPAKRLGCIQQPVRGDRCLLRGDRSAQARVVTGRVDGRHAQPATRARRDLCRRRLSSGTGELTLPPIEIGLDAAALARAKEVHGTLSWVPVAGRRRHRVGRGAQRPGRFRLPAGGCRPPQAGGRFSEQADGECADHQHAQGFTHPPEYTSATALILS